VNVTIPSTPTCSTPSWICGWEFITARASQKSEILILSSLAHFHMKAVPYCGNCSVALPMISEFSKRWQPLFLKKWRLISPDSFLLMGTGGNEWTLINYVTMNNFRTAWFDSFSAKGEWSTAWVDWSNMLCKPSGFEIADVEHHIFA
jgi:hypothetical protein